MPVITHVLTSSDTRGKTATAQCYWTGAYHSIELVDDGGTSGVELVHQKVQLLDQLSLFCARVRNGDATPREGWRACIDR